MDTLATIGRRLSHSWHPFSPDRIHLHPGLSRLFHSTRKALMVLLSLASPAGWHWVGRQVLALPEARMFYLALAFFTGYLWLSIRVPALHRNRLKPHRQLLR